MIRLSTTLAAVAVFGGTAFAQNPFVLQEIGGRALFPSNAHGGSLPDFAVVNTTSNSVSIAADTGPDPFTRSELVFPLPAGSIGPTGLFVGQIGGLANSIIGIVCPPSNTVVLQTLPGTPASTSVLPANTTAPRCIVFGPTSNEVFIGTEGDPFHPGRLLFGTRNNTSNTIDGLAEFAPIPVGLPNRIVALELGNFDADADLELLALAQGPGRDAVLLFDRVGSSGVFGGALMLDSAGTAQAFDFAQLNPSVDSVPDLLVLQPTLFPTPSNSLKAYTVDPTGPFGASSFVDAGTIPLPGNFGIRFRSQTKIDPTVAGADVLLVNGSPSEVVVLTDLDLTTLQFGGIETIASVSAAEGPVDAVAAPLLSSGRLTNRAVDFVVLNQAAHSLRFVYNVGVATATIGGTGCPGTGSLIPAISNGGGPVIGANMSVRLSAGLPSALDLLMFSFPPSPTPSFIGTPLGTSGCTLYPSIPILTTLRITDTFGQDVYRFSLPATLPGGIPVMFQWAVLDPNGAYLGVASMSDALHIVTGI